MYTLTTDDHELFDYDFEIGEGWDTFTKLGAVLGEGLQSLQYLWIVFSPAKWYATLIGFELQNQSHSIPISELALVCELCGAGGGCGVGD